MRREARMRAVKLRWERSAGRSLRRGSGIQSWRERKRKWKARRERKSEFTAVNVNEEWPGRVEAGD
jgi:hypothetical protein